MDFWRDISNLANLLHDQVGADDLVETNGEGVEKYERLDGDGKPQVRASLLTSLLRLFRHVSLANC